MLDNKNTVYKEVMRFREEHTEYFFSITVKNPTLSSQAFLYLVPANVVVPTAVESHIAKYLMFSNGIHWALRWSSRSFTRGFHDTQPTL
ncbi:hypothetical protein, partial [Pseudoalteromonas sp. P1-7a]|uniref:hypothetical protein n=1 Tax=Pseudoalteromonas sp. P1-7a TaxID=1723755 RepID=UPI001F1EC176